MQNELNAVDKSLWTLWWTHGPGQCESVHTNEQAASVSGVNQSALLSLKIAKRDIQSLANVHMSN